MARNSMQAVLPTVLPTPRELGRAVAELLATDIAAAAEAGQSYLLGCPSGRSPLPVYQGLAEIVREHGLSLRHVVVVMMDEYLTETAAGLVPVGSHVPHSCRGFAERQIVAPLAAAAAAVGQAGPSEILVPDPADPAAYDQEIAARGGIGLFVLATGASDGHIAFNQPGTPRANRTHVVELGEATRRDNLATFPSFACLAEVPRYGVSVGVATIADLSRQAVMVLFGEGKAVAFRRLAAARGYEADWPSTILTECRRPCLFADRRAAMVETASLS
ncbi:MAG: 6-phosphogluconolactonase [Candidatus Nanopelagicales bacterium]